MHSEFKKLPAVAFWGDFNVGKSALINALIHQPLLEVVRGESTPGFIFIANNGGDGQICWYRFDALTHDCSVFEQKAMIKWSLTNPTCASKHNRDIIVGYLPNLPFSRMVMVDSQGFSSARYDSDARDYLRDAPFEMLSVMVINCEYVGAKHSMEILKEIYESHPDRTVVALNGVDCLELDEILSLQKRTPKRLSTFGIQHVPPIYYLSAKLECERYQKGNQKYRESCKQAVIELCDIQFDRFRLFLYSWEAQHSTAKTLIVEQIQLLLHNHAISTEGIKG